MQALKGILISTVGAAALLTVLGMGPAAATPIFTITPDGLTGITGYSPQQVSDLNVTSDSTISQSGTTQTETGFAYATGFLNNGTPSVGTGLGGVSNGFADTYELYIDYSATVNGISGFGAGATGTIAAGGFTDTLYADIGDKATFAPGSAAGATATDPTVTANGDTQLVVAEGVSVAGSAGFQATTDAPTINVVTEFIVCDGTTNQGVLGGTTITGGAATGCGTFDGLNYFTAPSPFYDISLVSATAGSGNDLTLASGGTSATLDSVAADLNFTGVPEPLTLSLFGAGLVGVAGLRRRRSKKA
jgi:hypothetical protein